MRLEEPQACPLAFGPPDPGAQEKLHLVSGEALPLLCCPGDF